MSSDLTPHPFLLMPAMYTPFPRLKNHEQASTTAGNLGYPYEKNNLRASTGREAPPSKPLTENPDRGARRASTSPKDYDEMLLSSKLPQALK